MALETGSYISALVATNPTASDPKSQGDDHLRFVKAKILETFPSVTGAVTPTHTELNFVDGVTSAIQTQLDAKANLAGGATFTGAVVLPSTTSIGTVSSTEIGYLDNVTSAIQTQLDAKAGTVGPTFTGTVVLPSGQILTIPTINGYTESTVTANTSTAYTIDITAGTVQILTLTGNCTYTFPTATAGKSFLLKQIQDGTGSRTVTWPANVKWANSITPTLTSTAGRADLFAFTADGTSWYGRQIGGNYT